MIQQDQEQIIISKKKKLQKKQLFRFDKQLIQLQSPSLFTDRCTTSLQNSTLGHKQLSRLPTTIHRQIARKLSYKRISSDQIYKEIMKIPFIKNAFQQKNFSADKAKSLINSFKILKFQPQSILFDYKQPSTHVYYLISGSVSIFVPNQNISQVEPNHFPFWVLTERGYSNLRRLFDQNERFKYVEVSVFREGRLIGQLSVIQGTVRTAAVVTRQNCQLISIQKQKFFQFFNKSTQLQRIQKNKIFLQTNFPTLISQNQLNVNSFAFFTINSKFKMGTWIYRQGLLANGIFFIASGSVQLVSQIQQNGSKRKNKIYLVQVLSGQFFGQQCLNCLDNVRVQENLRKYSAYASRQVQVFFLSIDKLRDMLLIVKNKSVFKRVGQIIQIRKRMINQILKQKKENSLNIEGQSLNYITNKVQKKLFYKKRLPLIPNVQFSNKDDIQLQQIKRQKLKEYEVIIGNEKGKLKFQSIIKQKKLKMSKSLASLDRAILIFYRVMARQSEKNQRMILRRKSII